MAKFVLNTAMLASIASGATTHVAKSDDIAAHVKEGYIEVNPQVLDGNGNAAVRLTDKGTSAVGTVGTGTTSTATASPLFAISTTFELPPIKRGGNTTERASKYPLKDIPLMGALFIAAADGRDPKKMSKQFGSMVADFNKDNPDKYLTSRTIEDGKAAGFALPNDPEAFAGKPGIAIASRPVSERKVRKPRTPKTETTTA
jgi:hypothetical protein